jgi:hypothetical protein
MGPDIDVEMYRDGKVRVFRLPDGTEIRKKEGNGQQPVEVVDSFLKDELGLSECRLRFREISAPPRIVRRR